MSQIVPCLHGLYRDDSLRKQLSKSLPELLIQSAAIKLQCNSGSGGCFPCHFDSDAEVDGRRVTAIVYANLDWQPHDGGELRLYPVQGPRVDVEPRMGRMVLFFLPINAPPSPAELAGEVVLHDMADWAR